MCSMRWMRQRTDDDSGSGRDALMTDRAEVADQGWQPIESFTGGPHDVVLRPHRIWGQMDVKRMPVDIDGKHYDWMNGDYTTAWPEEAFLPFWMPLPAPPRS